MKFITKIIAAFLILTTIPSLGANFKFKKIDSNDGLSDNTISSIFQDHRGFLWIGTRDGLNKYDGYTFQVFRKQLYDTTSLSGNIITAINEDSNGNIWIGTQADGLSVYDTKKEKFARYKFLINDTNSIPGVTIWSIAKDKNGNMWFGTNNGLALYNPMTDNFTRFRFNNISGLETEGNVNGFAILPNGKFLLGYSKFGLVEFDPSNFTFKKIQDEINNLSGKEAINSLAIFYASDGTIWAGSEKNGLLRYNKEQKFAKTYHSDINNPNSLGSNKVVSIIEDSKKNIWIACESGGLNLYNPQTDDFTIFRNNISDIHSISLNSLIVIYEDKFNNIWFGGYGGGLNFLNLSQMVLQEFYHITGDTKSLASNIVTGFCEDDKKNIWISHEGSGMSLYNRSSNTFKSYPLPDGNKGDIVNEIEYLNNKLWTVGWGSGLHVFDPEKGQYKKVALSNNYNNQVTNNIKGICKDNRGNLWIATHSNEGVFVYNPQTCKTFSKDNPGSFNEEFLRSAIWNSKPLVDKSERIWMASYIGLFLWDGKFHFFKHSEEDSNSVINDYLITIFEDSRQNIWLATNGGLDLVKKKDSLYSFEHYSQKYGLPSRINTICEDKNGILWLSSNNQIIRFNPITKKKKYLNLNNGLTVNSFIEKSGLYSSTGELFFGTYDGLIVFNPDSIKDNPFVTSVYITDFQIFNKTPKIGNPGSPFKQSVISTEEIKIKYNQSVISFNYVGINLLGTEEIRYAYKLEGFDNDWVQAGFEKKATYTNLDPGNYTFIVKAANSDGIWNETGASMKITITPPWWKTKIAIITFILLIVSSFLGIYYFRVNQLKKQKGLLEKLVKERTHEIEEQDEKLTIANGQLTILNATKDKFFSIIAHDLRNPFNNILGFTEILNNDETIISDEEKKLITKQLYLSASSTYNLLENLLEWSRSQSNRIIFKPQQVVFADIYQEIAESLISNSKNVTFNYLPTKKIVLNVDINMFKTVLRNLISNAIKFSHINGVITVFVEDDDENVTITVSDNGTGIAKENLNNLFDFTRKFSSNGTAHEKGTGLGLIICKEFVEKHGGKIWVESEVGKGSDFIFSIPLSSQNRI
jgi:signal transduction histidine kinase/ligand-binding sensor domain-containing protein